MQTNTQCQFQLVHNKPNVFPLKMFSNEKDDCQMERCQESKEDVKKITYLAS